MMAIWDLKESQNLQSYSRQDNIGTNLSMNPMFNMMLGLSETEVREMIEYYRGAGLIKAPTDQLIAIVFKGNDLWKIEEC
mgnify:FL=1